jgi:predicted nucleotidyltransferase component of viral defense system
MDTFAKLKQAERQTYFEETASRCSSTTTAVEKDFWVRWTLKRLFALEGIPELRFKGGTSLSKVIRLIDRFSKDIDISIDRAALGFSGERDMANPTNLTQAKASLRVARDPSNWTQDPGIARR